MADDLEIFEMIPQSVLIEYLRLMNRVDFLKDSIRQSLEKGAKVEPGDVTAKLQSSKRRSPKWKEEFEKLVGADKVKEVIDATPEVEVVSLKVDIKKNAMLKREAID